MLASSGEITDPCPVPPVTRRHDPIFEHSRLEPFLYQADDAPIADPVLQKAHQPFLTDRIKEALNVGVDDPAHLRSVLLTPRFLRSTAARRPNSINRVLSRMSAANQDMIDT